MSDAQGRLVNEMHANEVYPHEMHACEVHAHEVHAYEVHGHEVYAREVHGHEVHARDMHAHEVHACEMIVSGLHRHRRYRRFLPTRVWPQRVGTLPASADNVEVSCHFAS